LFSYYHCRLSISSKLTHHTLLENFCCSHSKFVGLFFDGGWIRRSIRSHNLSRLELASLSGQRQIAKKRDSRKQGRLKGEFQGRSGSKNFGSMEESRKDQKEQKLPRKNGSYLIFLHDHKIHTPSTPQIIPNTPKHSPTNQIHGLLFLHPDAEITFQYPHRSKTAAPQSHVG